MARIQIKDLVKTFGAYNAVSGISMEIKDGEFDAIGGLAVGAVPMVTSAVISCFHHEVAIEGIFVRPVAKSHGTEQVVEGKLKRGDRVVCEVAFVTAKEAALEELQAKYADRGFTANTAKIPPIGTEVFIVLSPRPAKTVEKPANSAKRSPGTNPDAKTSRP